MSQGKLKPTHHDQALARTDLNMLAGLGGRERTLDDYSALLDAAGFDTVIIETVGVGQDEVEVARAAQVEVAGADGDELEAGDALIEGFGEGEADGAERRGGGRAQHAAARPAAAPTPRARRDSRPRR